MEKVNLKNPCTSHNNFAAHPHVSDVLVWWRILGCFFFQSLAEFLIDLSDLVVMYGKHFV